MGKEGKGREGGEEAVLMALWLARSLAYVMERVKGRGERGMPLTGVFRPLWNAPPLHHLFI